MLWSLFITPQAYSPTGFNTLLYTGSMTASLIFLKGFTTGWKEEKKNANIRMT